MSNVFNVFRVFKVTTGHNFRGDMDEMDLRDYLIDYGLPAFIVMDDYEGEIHCIGCCDTYSQCLDAMSVWESATDGACHMFTLYYDEGSGEYRRD